MQNLSLSCRREVLGGFLDPPTTPKYTPKYPLLRAIRTLIKGPRGGPDEAGF